MKLPCGISVPCYLRVKRRLRIQTSIKLNAAWVNLPIIRTQKLPIHIDLQCPAASCEIRLMPTQCHEMAAISPASCDP